MASRARATRKPSTAAVTFPTASSDVRLGPSAPAIVCTQLVSQARWASPSSVTMLQARKQPRKHVRQANTGAMLQASTRCADTMADDHAPRCRR